MTRGPIKVTETLIAKWRHEGRGEGKGAVYKPWVSVRDFSSQGRSHRSASEKLGRTVELLSDIEWHTFLLLEWAPDVLEIYEQFPLDRKITLAIAQEREIRHPVYSKTHIPFVMTVDFWVKRLRDGRAIFEAYNCKSALELQEAGVIERLEIARIYISGIGCRHHLVVDSELPMKKVKNIEKIRFGGLKEGEIEPYPGFYELHASQMLSELKGLTRNQTLHQYCSTYDTRHGVEPGTGLRVALMLMWKRALSVDLDIDNIQDAPLACFKAASLSGPLHVVGGQQ
jgi:hypothetical protein